MAFDPSQVGQHRAKHAFVVHATVLEEARVFNGQNSILHHFGDLGDRGEVATLFPEFTEQCTLRGVHAQRKLGAIVRQVGDIGKIGIGKSQGNCYHQGQGQSSGRSQTEQPHQNAQRPLPPR